MKIIHYCFGLPPYATGGLSIYAHDLASYQSKDNDVYVLFPGLKNKNICLKKINYIDKNIKLYRMDGALPCALNYGVKEPLDFIGDKSKEEVKKAFLSLGKIDVLHLHTIQGLYPEILKYFKENGTKIIFTTHDYFPFSLITKYYNDDETTLDKNIIQSIKAPKTKSLYLIRNPLFNKLKKLKLLKKIFNKKIKGEDTITYSEEYKISYLEKSNKLYSFYSEMIKDIDIIHANSNLSNELYSRYNKEIITIPVTHSKISNHEIKKNENNLLNLGFFGETISDKGFDLLLDVLDEIYKKNDNFSLNCYGPENLKKRPYLTYFGNYKFYELDEIYKNIDLVVLPSLSYETFSFVALEALSYKTPTIVSNGVGAKDLCNKDYIIKDKEELKELLLKIINNKEILNDYFNYDLKIETFENHNKMIVEKLYK